MDLVAHACTPSYWGGRGRRIESSRPAPFKTSWNKVRDDPISKINKNPNKRARGMAEVVESAPRMVEDLGSILSTPLKKKLR
jgi:hypothetical protein